jgi:lysine-specific demethylase 8
MKRYKSVKRIPFAPGATKLSEEPYVIEQGMVEWGAWGKWSFPYIKQVAGDYRVKMTLGNSEKDQTKLIKTTIGDFIDQYCLGDGANLGGSRDEVPYLQELNLLAEFPDLNADLELPSLYPQWCLTRTFSWMGTTGSMTGLHNDSLHNFHVQCCGRKRFLFIPTDKLPKSLISSKYDSGTYLALIDLLSEEYASSPFFEQLEAEIYEVVLEPGEILYIPRWWWHQVISIEPTISVNCFMSFAFDIFISGYYVVLEILHRLGLYKKGNCACHSSES